MFTLKMCKVTSKLILLKEFEANFSRLLSLFIENERVPHIWITHQVYNGALVHAS